jgi:AcrR family transcriptional regulator
LRARSRKSPFYEDKARATRRKIINEATKLFARQGFHKTTVADIARAIGMTQGALFHHFPSKTAILTAVIERLERGIDSYRKLLDGGGSAETVRRVMDLMVEHFQKQPEATVCLAALATEFAGTDAPVLKKIRRAYDIYIDAFATVLSNHPTIRDPRSAAIAFFGAVQGIAIQGLLREGTVPIDALADAFISILNLPKSW